jgi:hypothetical protein
VTKADGAEERSEARDAEEASEDAEVEDEGKGERILWRDAEGPAECSSSSKRTSWVWARVRGSDASVCAGDSVETLDAAWACSAVDDAADASEGSAGAWELAREAKAGRGVRVDTREPARDGAVAGACGAAEDETEAA